MYNLREPALEVQTRSAGQRRRMVWPLIYSLSLGMYYFYRLDEGKFYNDEFTIRKLGPVWG